MYRQTYLEVDCDILEDNIKNIRENYPEYKYYFGVVKGNAYGHGSYIINSLIKGGVNYLAVSSLEEAIALRNYNKEIPILVFEPINIEYVEEAIKNNITVTVSSIEYFRELMNLHLSNILKIHIKIDSGMSRLGLTSNKDLEELISSAKTNTKILVEGIYSHFATTGVNDKHWDNQLDRFKEITKNVNLNDIPIVHLNRSITLVNHPKISFCNGTRLGIVMYGMAQSITKPSGLRAFLRNLKNDYRKKKLNISNTTITNNLNLKTAITLYSEVMEIRTIKENDFVGYGASYISTGKARIATIPIGYADGIPRNLKHVMINNKIYNIVGTMCMDMICVVVDDNVKVHDKVILIGGDTLTVKKVSSECGTSSYTLFTNISSRVPRVYKEKNNYTEIKY